MAESAVNFVLDKVGPILRKEWKLLKGVRRDIEELNNELSSMLAWLKDANARGESDEGVKAWVRQVREVAYDTEDVLDEFMFYLASQPHRHGFLGFLRRTASFIKNLKERRRVAAQIQDIKTRVRSVSDRGKRYTFDQGSSSSTSTSNTWHDPRGASLLIDESDLVGIDKPRDDLIGWLVGGESRRTVISTVGMGGLGKTTIVKKVYESQRVKGYFHCRAWITVSQSFKIEELLQDMLKKFLEEMQEAIPEGIDTMKEVQLMEKLRDHLLLKRYVVVFDDVWSINVWESIKYALPNNNTGSRIMVTTRIEHVAAYCVESSGDHVYNLQPLPPKEAWTLFCRTAFRSKSGGYCPPELEELSRNILKRCEGLPLAIVVIGSLLSTKVMNMREWEKVYRSLGSELDMNPRLANYLTRILLLSYDDLPYFLKYFFLYLSIFPEDYPVKRSRLIRLWIAEGFVKEQIGKTLEEVAEDYLNELINRSIVQVEKNDVDGRVRSCRVHDLMREIILLKSKDVNICTILSEQNYSLFEKIRRLSIHKGGEINVPENMNFSHLRSLFVFGKVKLPDSITHTYFQEFRLLKVLDLEEAPLENLPSEFSVLLHLRYLSLRKTKVKKLPKSLGRLQNLETLDLKQTYISELPVEILKLKRLCHLFVYRYDLELYLTLDGIQGSKMPMEIGCLIDLQKLAFIEANQGVGSIVGELGKLTKLRKLGIVKLRRQDGIDLCASVEKMNHLRCLDVSSINDEELLDLQSLSSPPPRLQRLYLRGRLEELPRWVSSLHNLVRIRLMWSRLRDDPLQALQVLPNLVELELRNVYDGEQLRVEVGGFQKLKTLDLNLLNQLNLLSIEERAMPCLQELYIGYCGRLETVPFGIEYLINLKEIHLVNMPEELVNRLRKDGGEDRWRVQHIPLIKAYGFRDGVLYQQTLS